ncbi:MAG: type II toxin-antitoxin system RelE/ParE family toxin [Candidatus Cloacimonetes bacterium]|nr:type II toxin-antitoxin system RelE/ParE family toxin [Candidatus Cloacimonadota bacterium]
MRELKLTRKALKDLKKLDKKVARLILITLENFTSNPETVDIRKLQNKDNFWRIRVGDYRIIIKLEGKIISTKAIGHRKDIYKK